MSAQTTIAKLRAENAFLHRVIDAGEHVGADALDRVEAQRDLQRVRAILAEVKLASYASLLAESMAVTTRLLHPQRGSVAGVKGMSPCT